MASSSDLLVRRYWPTSQLLHSRSPPTLSLYFPASQSWHLELPSSDVAPASQSTHLSKPAVSALVLGRQSMHAELLEEPSLSFFFPAAHALQSVMLVTPIADEYFPFGQFIQNEELVAS